MPQYSFPTGYTELTFDTTRAITNMLYNGTLAKYPNIRWIMPHMGGVTPFLLFRLSGLNDDPKVREPDITRARTILNWEPKVSLEQGLTSTIAYFRQKLGVAAPT